MPGDLRGPSPPARPNVLILLSDQHSARASDDSIDATDSRTVARDRSSSRILA